LDNVDFADRKKVAAWFKTQKPHVCGQITSRAALRVFANISQFTGTEFARLALPSFRAVVTSAVRGSGRSADLDGNISQSATIAVADRLAANSNFTAALTAADSAAYSAPVSAAISARSIECSITSARTADSFGPIFEAISATRSALQEDKACLNHGTRMGALWPEDGVPPALFANHKRFLELLDQDADWSFWRDWYIAMWDGTFEDWDLAHEVAKIENEVWEGEDALAKVAGEIGRIETRRALEKEITDLKTRLKQSQAIEPSPNRHHNNPPPDALIEIERDVSKEIVLIWEHLDQVEEEIAKPVPDPSKLDAVAQALWDITARIAAYCGSLADAALQESARVVGKTGTQAGIVVFTTTTAAQNEGVKTVAKAIWEFAKTLTMG